MLEQRIDTQDVTEEVVDLESRIACGGGVSVGRVRELLEGSGDVAQLATVEGELARREARAQSLLGRPRVLDDQVAMATIRLDLREPRPVEESDRRPRYPASSEEPARAGMATASSPRRPCS